ncbi:hypothetical protein ACKFKF_07090 [Phormidesmis sp. 146-12]
MHDRDFLNRWFVVRLLPKMQRIVVARFCTQSEAEAYVKIVRQLIPEGEFLVLFDDFRN